MFHDLLRAETLAARIEALARARPEVGHLWHAEAALAEAVASVGLEGVRLGTGDLLPRVAMNGDQPEDARGAETALALLRALKHPGNPFADPLAVVRRFEQAAGGGGEVGGWSDSPEILPSPRLPDEKAPGLLRGIAPGDPPILAGLKAAARYRAATGGASPLVERLLFASVEGALRATGPRRRSLREEEDDVLRGLGGRIGADWIALPATALSHGTLRLWRPSEARGMEDLVEGLGASLGAELGRIGQARVWCDVAATATAGRHGLSRLPDAVRQLALSPLTNARELARALGVTERGALKLLGALMDLELVQEITHRRSWRIWATPALAERLGAGRRVRPSPRVRDPLPFAPRPEIEGIVAGRPSEAALARRAARAERDEADLDAAMARIDALLKRPDDLLGPAS